MTQDNKPFNACVKSLKDLTKSEKDKKVDIHKMLVASLTLHKTVDKYKRSK